MLLAVAVVWPCVHHCAVMAAAAAAGLPGVKKPCAVVVCHSNEEQALKAVESLRSSFKSSVPIYACAQNFK